MSLVCGFCAERGKAGADTASDAVVRSVGCERECADQRKLRGVEYRCGACRRTGP